MNNSKEEGEAEDVLVKALVELMVKEERMFKELEDVIASGFKEMEDTIAFGVIKGGIGLVVISFIIAIFLFVFFGI